MLAERAFRHSAGAGSRSVSFASPLAAFAQALQEANRLRKACRAFGAFSQYSSEITLRRSSASGQRARADFPRSLYRLIHGGISMANEDWVVFFNTLQAIGVESRCPSEGAALIRARSCLRRHYEVSKIQGPNGVVIQKAKIERWVKENPLILRPPPFA
jgi:hypothetical protein